MPECRGDHFLLKRMVFNILSNCLKYTAKEKQPQIHVWGYSTETWAFYCFRDNGVGFDKNKAEKLFGMFERFHNESEFEGSGVGLSTVKKIVDRLNGQIDVEAKKGGGCLVVVALPTAIA